MTNNEFLRQLHEGMIGAWGCQLFSEDSRWIDCPRPNWIENTDYRLIPAVPEDCEPPPEEAYAYGPDKPGAVYLKGPVDRPKGGGLFSGWAIDPSDKCDQWDYAAFYGGVVRGFFYLLDLTDHNAREILALNKPEWKLPESGPTPEQQAAMAELTAEAQERSEYNLPKRAPDLVIPAEKMRAVGHPQELIEEVLAKTALMARLSGYSIRWDDSGIVGWRDE